MTSTKTGAGVVRRPPTNAKLVRLLEEMDATSNATEANADASRAYFAASWAVQKLYRTGLPPGLDPAVVTNAVTAVMPLGYELFYLTRRVGTEYDAAIVAGVRAHRADRGLEFVLWPALVATLTEHAGVPIAAANRLLLDAEALVGCHGASVPADRGAAVLDGVSAAMDAWFAPGVVAHTLSVAREAMPPTRWSNAGGDGVTPPHGGSQWALFIACALHPSEEAAAVLAPRVPLISRLDEPNRTAVCDVLRHARRLHGTRVPMPVE
ncbi:MAG: hypothetical protein V4850_02985 [Myxococcota bacterium]